jgi:anti-repressor protein
VKRVTVITDEQGNPWWLAYEVCRILGLGNTTMAVRRLDDEEKSRFNRIEAGIKASGNPVPVVNESGLYKLIMRSDKPEAKAFQDWVTKEVLPQIRKTGGYVPVKEGDSDVEILSRALLIAQRTLDEKDNIIRLKDQGIEERDNLIDYQQKEIEGMEPLECCDGQSR